MAGQVGRAIVLVALGFGALAAVPVHADGLGGGTGTDPVCCIVPPDGTPDPFAFAPVDGVMPGVTVTSAPVTLTGFDVALWAGVDNGWLDIECDGNLDLPVTNEPRSVVAGDTVCVVVTAPSTCDATRTATLVVGSTPADFTVTTQSVADGCVNPPASGGGALSPLWLLLAGLLRGRSSR